MIERIRIQPAPGLTVRKPGSRIAIPTGGLSVNPADPYWRRLIADGDVVPVAEIAPPPQPQPEIEEELGQ